MKIPFKEPILCASLLPPDTESTDEQIFSAMKQLKYPVGATLKKDGIRAIRVNGSLYSRRIKLIPNKLLREQSLILPGGFDMELWNKELEYRTVESIVMSHTHPDTDKIQFHILDWFGPTNGFDYSQRCRLIAATMPELDQSKVKFSPPVICHNAEQLFAFFLTCEAEAGEGICFRLLDSPYKQGRSTLKQQYLVKLCRWTTEEASIIGVKEQLENGNPTRRNKTGKMDRQKLSEEMYGKDTLGAFSVIDKNGIQFDIGTGVGLTDELRKHLWINRNDVIGKTIVYKCKPHGKHIKPRSPVYKGFRNMEIDG